ncbi:NADH:flavin oxidoreductase [Pseudaquabacterium pictum]|uniref:Putative NADH-dependent flavin oxidoreductase YqiG n=1 Tax=Pseudaquabacterium pictum TaxID=2315236 RepID=A0A480AUE7_9BURK|nr:NADH:flavin oxidoreductase [Rubrivivax pictus]GCL63817.1 putative NADH-dependent flavin oxidoreductase YqiG [Rubrivivax pictus]
MPDTIPRLSDPLPFARGPAMANRFMLAPLTNWQSNADGTLADAEYHWLTMRARGGFALTMTCAAHVQRGGQGFPGQLGVWSDDHLPGLTRLAAGIHAGGGGSSLQIQHSGRRSDRALTGEQPVCPWDDAETGARALTTAEVEQLIEDFITAAVRAERAGFHGVELHGAHGYLLAQFLDGENNQRSDRFGGSFVNRCRVLHSIIDGVRARTGPAFQLGLRLSPERFGITMPESLALATQVLADGKLDYLDMSLWDCFKPPIDAAFADRPLIDHFAALPRGTTRLGVAGKIMDAATAQRCLEHGADFVLIGRGAMLHHDFAARALADPAFQCVERPVTRAWLEKEGLGPAFIGYVASTWKNFVSD